MGVEIAVLTFVIYRFYIAISDTKATEVFGLLFGIAVVYLLCVVLRLDVLTSIINTLIVPFLMLLCVFYHPELRRAFSSSFTGDASGNSFSFSGTFDTPIGALEYKASASIESDGVHGTADTRLGKLEFFPER